FAYLRGLLFKNPDIYRGFLVRPNPTIKHEGGHYVFLVNSYNIESFQRMRALPVLPLFIDLSRARREGMPYKELIETLREHIDASTEQLETYANQLLAYGLLEFNLGVSGIDPDWDIKLKEKLMPTAEHLPIAQKLLGTLTDMRSVAEDYGKVGVNERKEI